MPNPTPQIGLVLDCADPEALARFWAPALGYVNLGSAGAYVALVPDGQQGPKLIARWTLARQILDGYYRLPDSLPEGAEALFERFSRTGLEVMIRDNHGVLRPATPAEHGWASA